MARLVQGSGSGVANSLFRAVMRDSFSGERMAQAASYMGIAFAFSPAAAPILGGYIQAHFGWRANFIVLMLIFMFGFAVIYKYLPETNRNLKRESTQIRV